MAGIYSLQETAQSMIDFRQFCFLTILHCEVPAGNKGYNLSFD